MSMLSAALETASDAGIEAALEAEHEVGVEIVADAAVAAARSAMAMRKLADMAGRATSGARISAQPNTLA